MGVALWYCPPVGSQAYETLELLISSLQSMFPNSPFFEPHLTLTSDLVCNSTQDVDRILTSCAAAVQSIRSNLTSAAHAGSSSSASLPSQQAATQLVSFESCTVGRHFFQKLVLNCRKNRYLYSIAQIMRELYVEVPDPADSQATHTRAAAWLMEQFHPHVSLLYSDVYRISPAFLRIIQQRLQDALDTTLDLDTTAENTTWNFRETPQLSWSVPGTFKIVKCIGPPDEWEVLGKVDV